MREEDLQLLITLDDPVEPPEEDAFKHLVANNLGYWFAQTVSGMAPVGPTIILAFAERQEDHNHGMLFAFIRNQ